MPFSCRTHNIYQTIQDGIVHLVYFLRNVHISWSLLVVVIFIISLLGGFMSSHILFLIKMNKSWNILIAKYDTDFIWKGLFLSVTQDLRPHKNMGIVYKYIKYMKNGIGLQIAGTIIPCTHIDYYQIPYPKRIVWRFIWSYSPYSI